MINRTELLEYFLSEAMEYISILESGIPKLQYHQNRADLVEDLFRVAHSLKGSAALVKLSLTSNLAHKMEDLLESLLNNKIKVNSDLIQTLNDILDGIKTLIYRVSKGQEECLDREHLIAEETEDILKGQRSEAYSAGIPSDAQKTVLDEAKGQNNINFSSSTFIKDLDSSNFKRMTEDPLIHITKYVKVDSQNIEEILNIVGELVIKKNYLFRKTQNLIDISDEIFFSNRRLLFEVNNFVERYAYSTPENIKYIDPLLSEFCELEFDRYDDLNLFSRKLQEITNDVNESLKALNIYVDFLQKELKEIDKLLKTLKLTLTDLRMVEIGVLFKQFIKPIGEISKRLNKEIELITLGGSLKVDRVIFERLFNPLLHLLMNAIVHGIESGDIRSKKNKKAMGTVILSAREDRGTAIIEVIDDGRGIDLEVLHREAIRLGIIKPEDKVNEEFLLSLIFLPGFSTAQTVEIEAGRGMGLSVVKRMVSAINGSIEIFTERDVGTTFRIKVPLTLAITNVLLFKCAGLDFCVPYSLVEEVMSISVTDDLKSIEHRGKKIELIDLMDFLGIKYKSDKSQKHVLICNVFKRSIGLIVDQIIGHEETIIKPMHSFLEGLEIYTGISISGEGTIRFVINPMNLVEKQFKPFSTLDLDIDKKYVRKNILVVDDSLSVRKYLSTLLQSKNFNVFTATNGAEALDLINSNSIDMIITDLEMPVLHGYELIAKLKTSEKHKNIPIIVLTSRGGEKHQEKALDLGVKDYLIKPFDEESLLQTLNKHFALFPL